MAKVAFVSLGCPKNLVDSECSLASLAGAGHELVADKSAADVIVVNTCGFIESARAESVEHILSALEIKASGGCRAVVVVGCLAQRFGGELARELPEIDAILGIDHPGSLAGAICDALSGRRVRRVSEPAACWREPAGRIRSTPRWTAYLKISDGCDNRCSYCAIPYIRGRFRSRPLNLVLDEAKRLADEGARELILVGQDVTQYGCDIGAANSLPGLLEKLNGISGLHWVRLMYCYPSKVTPELVDAVAGLDRVAKYVDMPVQHGDPDVLRAMNRRGTVEDCIRAIESLRAKCPRIAIRTSLIVGFPGETREAFGRLVGLVKTVRFDRVGAFAYSREEGTPAAKMKKHVGRRTAQARLDELMGIQQGISLEINRGFVGESLEVLVEGADEDGVWGRSYRDAPEIDGVVKVRKCAARPGEIVRARITAADIHDLEGEYEQGWGSQA